MTPYFAMAALSLAAVFWLTRPLWRQPRAGTVARRTANVLAHQTRLAELEADVAAGVLTPDAAQSLRLELDGRLIDDAAVAESSPVASRRLPLAVSVGVALVCVTFAGLWDWQAGSWQTARQITQGPAAGAPGDAEIEAMVTRLAERLASKPEDPEGWGMLGRSYFVMGRYADAARAYGEANARTQSSRADWLVDEGEALALARDRDLLGRPAQLFETALTLEPGYGKGLWYGALADAQAGNSARASERLRQLLQQELPEQLRSVVQARLEALGGMAAEPPPKTAEAASEAGSGRLVVQVTLAPALAAKVPPGATLFVFAKAAGGPPMPLAVQRLPGARLPVTVTLDDSMAMMPSMKLSQFERYVLTARLSATGGAQASAGDLEGSLEASRGHDGVIALEISREVR